MKEFESGRSMVEMLGTLAIIGVLSIGGIAGYSYGMDKYRANTTMNDVNLRAVDLIAQVNRGGDLSLSEWPEKSTAGYDIGLEVDTATNTTDGGIYVDKIPQQVCDMIAEDLLPASVLLTINGEGTAQGKCKEENKLIFYYDAVTGTGKNETEECNGVMINDVCTSCPENTTLSADKTTCICSSGIWDMDSNECATPPSECAQSLASCGADGAKAKMSGSTIIYNGDLNCSGGGDFSDCTLKVNGTLNLGDLSSFSDFKCKSITAESSTGPGITATNITKYNSSSCKLLGKTSVNGHYGVFLTNVSIRGEMEIEGHATNIQTSGGGVHLRGGTIYAGKIIGTVNNSETGYGVYMEGMTVTNSTTKGTANTTGTGGAGIFSEESCFMEDLVDDIPSVAISIINGTETDYSTQCSW